MCRQSQLLLFVCLMACGLLTALSPRAGFLASSQTASLTEHSAATVNQRQYADLPSWWNQVAEEPSDTPSLKILATSAGIVTDHKLVHVVFSIASPRLLNATCLWSPSVSGADLRTA